MTLNLAHRVITAAEPIDAGGNLRARLAAVCRHSPVLVVGGALLLLSMLPTWVLSSLYPQQFNGIDAYAKPLKFEFSMGIYLLCLAWMRDYLTPTGRASRIEPLTTLVPTVAALGEAAYILYRASMGEASHFNVGTPSARALYTVMGIGAVFLVGASGALAWLLRRHARPELNAAFLMSVRYGLWLTMILGGLAGIYLSTQAGHAVGAAGSDIGGLALTGWSRHGGDLRVAHFFGIHAMQILPLLGWALAHRLPDRRANVAVHAAAALYALLSVATFLQAVAGLPFLLGL